MNKEALAAQMTPYQADIAAEKPRPFLSAAASGPPIDRFVMTHTICLGKHHFATDKTDTAYLYGCKKTSNQLLCEKKAKSD